MKMYVLIIITIMFHTQKSTGIHLIDLPESDDDIHLNIKKGVMEPEISSSKMYPPIRSASPNVRRWLKRERNEAAVHDDKPPNYEDDKDENIKSKIATLVQQTLYDTERKIKSIQHIKERNRELPPYRAGFILSMIKKSRDVLNELFNVAVKHRDEWKALEQLKIFELIVHTNVDTTNLVRQMVEIHIQHLNSTNGAKTDKKRVVLL